MKIIIVGDYSWKWYQDACADALEEQGHYIVRYSWFDIFRKWVSNHSEPIFHSFFHKFQYAYSQGPLIAKINKELIECIEEESPDAVWFYNVKHIKYKTILSIKKRFQETFLVQFSNDNPFSKQTIPRLWRDYIRSIPLFDHSFSYRDSNIGDYKKNKAKKVSILLPYFDPKHDFPIERSLVEPAFICDVVFAGHYENDGRLNAIENILYQGIDLKLYGGGWADVINKLPKTSPLKRFNNVMPAIGEDYRKAICGAKISLCFLSSINQDNYTRRNFQIPAMKRCLLSKKTEQLKNFFLENKEMIFFENYKEIPIIIEKYLQDNYNIDNIAEAAYKRVYKDGHDVSTRMKYFIQEISNIK